MAAGDMKGYLNENKVTKWRVADAEMALFMTAK